MNKSLLRKTLLHYRRLLSGREFNKRNDHVSKQLLNLIEQKDVKIVHTFLPIRRNKEFDIRPTLPILRQMGVKIMTSKTDFVSKTMQHFWLDTDSRLAENSLGIPEPTEATPAALSEADLVLVPLLAADKCGNRIGYGGGFYDRLLQNYSGRSVGICLSSLFDQLDTDPWDVALQQLLFFKGSLNLEKP